MTAHLEKIKQLIHSLKDDTLKGLEAISSSKTFSKGEYLLQEGSVARKSYWVESGIVRKFYVHEDREITTEFCFADDLAISFHSYTLQEPSREYIQAITDTKVTAISYAAFQAAKQQYSQLQYLDVLLTEAYALWLEEKVLELYTRNATQRYEMLLEKAPHIIQQVSLTQIASYLNVSLETLSRIRSRI